MLFDCSSELLKKFRYPWEMMPIMYALSKYANGNIEEVLRKIDEGTICKKVFYDFAISNYFNLFS
jgi:hypothetical protein